MKTKSRFWIPFIYIIIFVNIIYWNKDNHTIFQVATALMPLLFVPYTLYLKLYDNE